MRPRHRDDAPAPGPLPPERPGRRGPASPEGRPRPLRDPRRFGDQAPSAGHRRVVPEQAQGQLARERPGAPLGPNAQPATGSYLDMVDNAAAKPPAQVPPDENHDRELLQLLSIGSWLLHEDGTPVVGAAGVPGPADRRLRERGLLVTNLRCALGATGDGATAARSTAMGKDIPSPRTVLSGFPLGYGAVPGRERSGTAVGLWRRGPGRPRRVSVRRVVGKPESDHAVGAGSLSMPSRRWTSGSRERQTRGEAVPSLGRHGEPRRRGGRGCVGGRGAR